MFLENAKYHHFCHEWDGLEIDESWPEFTCCNCYDPSDEIKAIKDKLYDIWWMDAPRPKFVKASFEE